MSIRVVQLKPNPAGKDSLGLAFAAQLAAEWVDVRNDAKTAFDVSRLSMFHRAYAGASSNWQWGSVIASGAEFTGFLQPGQVLRIHSGRVRELGVIRAEDRVGADLHGFTGRDAYIWNNSQGDMAAIWNAIAKVFIDQAEYLPYPPEGTVLVRSGDLLVPGASTSPTLATLLALGGRR
jgi:hypothetical protein